MKKKIILLIIAAIIVAAGIGGYFYFRELVPLKPQPPSPPFSSEFERNAIDKPPRPPERARPQKEIAQCGDNICDEFEKANQMPVRQIACLRNQAGHHNQQYPRQADHRSHLPKRNHHYQQQNLHQALLHCSHPSPELPLPSNRLPLPQYHHLAVQRQLIPVFNFLIPLLGLCKARLILITNLIRRTKIC